MLIILSSYLYFHTYCIERIAGMGKYVLEIGRFNGSNPIISALERSPRV